MAAHTVPEPLKNQVEQLLDEIRINADLLSFIIADPGDDRATVDPITTAAIHQCLVDRSLRLEDTAAIAKYRETMLERGNTGHFNTAVVGTPRPVANKLPANEANLGGWNGVLDEAEDRLSKVTRALETMVVESLCKRASPDSKDAMIPSSDAATAESASPKTAFNSPIRREFETLQQSNLNPLVPSFVPTQKGTQSDLIFEPPKALIGVHDAGNLLRRNQTIEASNPTTHETKYPTSRPRAMTAIRDSSHRAFLSQGGKDRDDGRKGVPSEKHSLEGNSMRQATLNFVDRRSINPNEAVLSAYSQMWEDIEAREPVKKSAYMSEFQDMASNALKQAMSYRAPERGAFHDIEQKIRTRISEATTGGEGSRLGTQGFDGFSPRKMAPR